MDQFGKVSCNSLQRGKHYFAKNNFGRAFAHFLVALKLTPGLKSELRLQFTDTLEKWGSELEKRQRFDDLFNCYEQAIAIFPENELIYHNLGIVLMRCGSPKEAADYIRKYNVATDYENLGAVRDWENACNLAVERWHYRMLNDQLRNLSFREAIIKKIKQGFRTVLDIGTGTGILSLFATEGGSCEVFACDSSAAMVAIASEVFEHHNCTNVKLLTKHSTDLKVPEDLEQRVSLVVCEIVDCGLLGEHVLETLVHAWENLLEPSGVVLPLAAALHISGIQSYDISQSWVLKNVPSDYGFEEYNIVASSDSYDTERLSMLPNGYKVLSEETTALIIEFNDPEEMRSILEGKRDKNITLKVDSAGTLDCVAGWFTLRVDEDIALQTGPESPISCWEQAIFPALQPISVKPGDELTVSLSFKAGKLSLKFLRDQFNEEKNCAIVSQAIIKMINDTKWIKALQVTADHIISTKKTGIRVLDLCPFPLLGFSILKAQRRGDQLICTFSADHDKDFIANIACGLELQHQMLCLSEEIIAELIEQRQKFDVILLPVVEETGELNEMVLSKLNPFRECLNADGLLLPQRLTTMGLMVESNWLKKVSRVVAPEVTCGYDIASFVNKYSVDQQIDFKITAIDKVERSDPFQLLDLNPFSCKETLQKTVSLSTTGQGNAIVYWHEISLLQDITNAKIITTDANSHVNQAAQLIAVQKANHVSLLVKYDKGLFRMTINDRG